MNCAADYFAQARKPRAEWKKLDDLAAQLAEFDLRCAAGDYDTAADVLTDFDFDYLFLWGHYRLMIDLHEKLQGKINDKTLARMSVGNLGTAYNNSGKYSNALNCYTQAVTSAKESHERQGEGQWLMGIGNCYANLGEPKKAIEFYEQALAIAREISNKRDEGYAIWGLGNTYMDLGNTRQALQYYQEQLKIVREINDKFGEGRALGLLGTAYATLGDIQKAIEFYEQELLIAREIGDRGGEESALVHLGSAYATLGDVHKAIELYKQELLIAREIGDRRGEGMTLSNLASQYSSLAEYDKSVDFYYQALQNAREIGNKYGESKRLNGLTGVLIEKGDLLNAIKNSQESLRIGQEMSSPEVCIESGNTLAIALLFSEKLIDALQVVQEASKFDKPNYFFNVSTLHGIIALRQGDGVTARQAFTRAIAQADEILAKTPDYYSALDAKGLALCGKVISGEWEVGSDERERDDVVAEAVETFRKARKIAPHAGVVKSVLRLFDELVKCDEEGILKEVRSAVEGM